MKYIVSSDLVLTSKGVVRNARSGEQFEITPEVLKLLRRFRGPLTISEAMKVVEASSREKSAIKAFLRRLCDCGLLVRHPETKRSYGASILALTNKVLVQPTQKTFFSCPSADLTAVKRGDIAFLGVPFDLGTTGFPGARFAPDRMRDISSDSFEYHADIFSGAARGWFSLEHNRHILEGRRLVDVGNVILQVGEGFDQFYERVTLVVHRLLQKGAFPVVVGGDHSSSYACIRSFQRQYGGIGVIHIDAHTDMGELLPGIPNNHGNVFTRVLKERLTERLYQFGVRGMIGNKLTDKRYTLFPLHQITMDLSVEAAVAQIEPTLKYYLSIDIDVLDPAYAPGTGTASPNGMNTALLFQLVSLVASRVKVLGFDLVEVNPMLDHGNRTLDVANSILMYVLSELERGPRTSEPSVTPSSSTL